MENIFSLNITSIIALITALSFFFKLKFDNRALAIRQDNFEKDSIVLFKKMEKIQDEMKLKINESAMNSMKGEILSQISEIRALIMNLKK